MIKEVDNLYLNDGSVYSGLYDDLNDRPYGAGKCAYPDGSEAIGTFIGIPNGVSYVNKVTRMQLGYFTQGYLQGWGMHMGDGDYRFGIYHRGKLIKDYTNLIEATHERITLNSRNLRAKGVDVRWGHFFPDKNEAFFGLAVKGYKMIGIRFMPSGDVYIGMSPYSLELTGTFVHLKDTFVESGVFEKGSIVEESKGFLYHSDSWIELLYTDEVKFDSKDEEAFNLARITRSLLFN